MCRAALMGVATSLIVVGCARATSPIGPSATDGNARAGIAIDSEVDTAALPVATATNPAPEAGAQTSPLHLVLRTTNDNDDGVPELHVCPVRGVTWLCGTGVLVVAGGTIMHDRTFEAGLPQFEQGGIYGAVQEVVGHWPDDAWLMFRRAGLPPYADAVYRWRGDRWILSQKVPTSYGEPSLAAWGRGAALLVERAPMGPKNDSDPESGRFRGLGVRAGSLIRPARISQCKSELEIERVVPFANGSFIANIDCTTRAPLGSGEPLSLIERWSSPWAAANVETLPIDTDAGAKVIDIDGIDGDSPDDVTAFGDERYGVPFWKQDSRNHGYLAHFDGQTWSEEPAPPGTRRLTAYVRNAGGSSWAIAYPSDRPQLWSRTLSGPWAAVAIPAIAPHECEPVTLSKAEDGSVWVWCRVRPSREGYLHGATAALFSTLAPSRVIELEELF